MSACVVCKANVTGRQHALECDACGLVHCKCQSGMLCSLMFKRYFFKNYYRKNLIEPYNGNIILMVAGI